MLLLVGQAAGQEATLVLALPVVEQVLLVKVLLAAQVSTVATKTLAVAAQGKWGVIATSATAKAATA
tara:strand:+ start:362 stop:562 length:201 start_codon:yes stop_codon:yes gene_type:complete